MHPARRSACCLCQHRVCSISREHASFCLPNACGPPRLLCQETQSSGTSSTMHSTCHGSAIITQPPCALSQRKAAVRAQVDFSHKAGAPLASEAHPVRTHVATDLAQVGLSTDEDERWNVRSEVFNYEERMEWKKELGAMPARRYMSSTLQIRPLWSSMQQVSHPELHELHGRRLHPCTLSS